MPVSAALLKKLQETLGDEATSDLVTWVDHAAARDIAQLRDLAELHYERFDSRLEQRLAEMRTDWRNELRTEASSLHAELSAIREELARIDARSEAKLAALRLEMATQIADLRTEMASQGADLRSQMASQRADLMKWMLVYWAGTIIPLAGLMTALIKL